MPVVLKIIQPKMSIVPTLGNTQLKPISLSLTLTRCSVHSKCLIGITSLFFPLVGGSRGRCG